MHRICTLLLFILLLSPKPKAQNPMGAWKWFNTCSQSTGGYGYNRVWDMCSAPNGDLVVAGTYYKQAHFSGNKGTGLWLEAVGKKHWISSDKFFLAKYRKSGELAWIQTGIGGHNSGSAVKTDSLGNIYCLLACSETIYLESSDGKEIVYSFGAPNGPGTLLVKYSPTGKILWHLVFDVHSVTSRDLDIGPNGEVFLLIRGHHEPSERSMTLPSVSGKDTALYIYPPIPNHLTSTSIVCQYNPEGELTWAKNHGSDSLGLYGTGIAANPLGGFALGLHFVGHGEYLGHQLDSRMGGAHSLLLNYDAKGELVYSTQFGEDVYTQHEGGPPHFRFDPQGRLIVATAVDYSPIRFSPAKGKDLLLKGFNQYTCYLLLLRLNQEGAIDWKYAFKDIDFDGHPGMIYPWMANPSLRGLEIAPDGQIYIVGTALNYLKLTEGVEYKYDPITEGKHWRTRHPYLAAFDSCGNPFWLESIKVNREHNTNYLSLCLHGNDALSLGSQLRQNTTYTLQGKPIVKPNTNQLLFGRRKRPQLSAGACGLYTVIDTFKVTPVDSTVALADSALAAVDSAMALADSALVAVDSTMVQGKPVTPPVINPSPADSLPPTGPVVSPPQPVAAACISSPILFPNPNNGNFNLQWKVGAEQEFVIRIANMKGQVLVSEKRRFPPGNARMQFMGLGLAQGPYIATILCNSELKSIRFVIR